MAKDKSSEFDGGSFVLGIIIGLFLLSIASLVFDRPDEYDAMRDRARAWDAYTEPIEGVVE